ncbi:MAG: hypothetical protein M0030_06855 [Actinomycetota bacterium]|nr:hypothetical protein [Actinomycetota bacterium]
MTVSQSRSGLWGRQSRLRKVLFGLVPFGLLTLILWATGLIDTSATLLAYATAMLALGTVGLAVGTVLLYLEQRDDIEVARQHVQVAEHQAEIASRSLQASTQPWLTHSPGPGPFIDAGDRSIKISVALKNIGNGLAIIRPQSVMLGMNASTVCIRGNANNPVIAPGEITNLRFLIDKDDPNYGFAEQISNNKHASMRLTYTDAADQQPTTIGVGLTAVVNQSGFGDRDIRIDFIRYFHGTEASGEPFVVARVSPF